VIKTDPNRKETGKFLAVQPENNRARQKQSMNIPVPGPVLSQKISGRLSIGIFRLADHLTVSVRLLAVRYTHLG
jgi:hypothetical protein